MPDTKRAHYYTGEFVETVAADGDEATVTIIGRDNCLHTYRVWASALDPVYRSVGPHPSAIAYGSCSDCGVCKVWQIRSLDSLATDEIAQLQTASAKGEAAMLEVDDNIAEKAAPGYDALGKAAADLQAHAVIGLLASNNVKVKQGTYTAASGDTVPVAMLVASDAEAEPMIYLPGYELAQYVGMGWTGEPHKTAQWFADNADDGVAAINRALKLAIDGEVLRYRTLPVRFDDKDGWALALDFPPAGEVLVGVLATNELDDRIS